MTVPLRTRLDSAPAASADHPRRISVLGATGSIGENTLDLIGRAPGRYRVVALTGGEKVERLAELAIRHQAEIAVTAADGRLDELRKLLEGTGVEAAAGRQAVIEAASRPADWIMAAIVGVAGLQPTHAALTQGTTVAVANKECLVCAGPVFMAEVRRHGATLLPVDSEHSAAMQILSRSPDIDIDKLCLTASGGPFRSLTREQMSRVTPHQALKHPNWSMGPKITLDSATLMNKALEMLEAQHLFDLPAERIDTVIHPQSIVHCLVYYRDGSVLAHLSPPDMRTPIAYTLAWPERMRVPMPPLDLPALASLTFEAPDPDRFPALRLARQALLTGHSAGAVLNAANEVAAAAFLAGKIGFVTITEIVERVVGESSELVDRQPGCIEDVISIDEEARRRTMKCLPAFT